jgi:hypothetical protein
MPIDVSYAPFAPSFPGWVSGPVPLGPIAPGEFMPRSGPARAIDCLPAPNKCLPNGLRNPWAPYAGETYQPVSVAVANRQMHQATGGSLMLGDGGGGSVITPSHLVGAGAAGSLIAPSAAGVVLNSTTGTRIAGGLGGLREDDGWNGSAGRDHRGVEPDLMSTSGALGPIASSASWMTWSSPANHVPLSRARYNPPSPLVLAQSSPRVLPGGYGQPAESVSFVRPRRHCIRPAMFANGLGNGTGNGTQIECPECTPRTRFAAPAGGAESPYRKVAQVGHGAPVRGSPLRAERELPLNRKVSLKSHRSGGTPPSRRCSECSGTQDG